MLPICWIFALLFCYNNLQFNEIVLFLTMHTQYYVVQKEHHGRIVIGEKKTAVVRGRSRESAL